MEYPGEWDLLTASLSVSDLKQPYEAWSFLVLQGLVRDRPGDREAFVKLVEAAANREPIPGPSGPLLIAGELMRTGVTTDKAAARDPFGKVAEKRRQQVEGWKRTSPSGQNQGQSRWKFWRRDG